MTTPTDTTPAVPSTPVKQFEASIPITEAGRRVIDWLAENTPISRMQLKKAINAGAIVLQTGNRHQRMRRATILLPINSTLHVYYDADIVALVPPQPTLIKMEKGYSVWFKPAGLLSQGSKQGDHCSLMRIVELQTGKHAFLVHRLDLEASGLMLVAHTDITAAALSSLFHTNTIYKCYRATVSGELALPELPFKVDADVDRKKAVTWIDTVSYDAATHQTQVRVHIDTGRKHQIRRHLAGLGHPVIGDSRYGTGQASKEMMLQAYRLEFVCPIADKKRSYSLPEPTIRSA